MKSHFLCNAVGVSAAFLLLATASARADLFVIAASEPAGHGEVFRLEEHSGSVLNRWTTGTEAIHGIAVSILGDVYVAADTLGAGEIIRFSPAGEQLGGFGDSNLTMPAAMTLGPDGNFYVLSAMPASDGFRGQVLRFSSNGKQAGVFVAAQNGTGRQFVDLAFRGEDHLLVVDFEKGVLRFDARSGQFLGVFIPTGDELVTPSGIAVGPDGNLYVSSREANVVLRFDGSTGQYMDTFVSPGTRALNGPMGLTFGNDGNLYVASCYDHHVVRFNGKTGDFAGMLGGNDLHFPTRITSGAVPFLMARPLK